MSVNRDSSTGLVSLMTELKDAEIDVDELKLRIREAARAMKESIPSSGNGSSALNLIEASPGDSQVFPSAAFELSEEFRQRSDARYHVKELLKYYDEEFIENAYLAILKREPDPVGYERYLEHIRSGRFDRIDVLASLSISAEGREREVKVEGLLWRARLRRLYRLPVLGYLIEWLVVMARLPLLLRQQRQLEEQTQGQQRRIAARINQVSEQVTAHVNQVSERVNAHLERASNQVSEHSTRVQQHINQVSEHVDQVYESISGYFQKLSEDMNRLATIDEQRAATLSEQLRAEMQALSEQMGAQSLQFSQHSEQFAQRLQATRAELVRQERRTLQLLDELRQLPLSSSGQQGAQVIAEEERRLSDTFYAAFEEHFRGSREEIINRLQVYLPFLKAAGITGGVLDIGTGRGEWLELLRREGIEGLGIDTNSLQVEACRTRGLEVVNSDAIAYLHGLPDNHLHAITGFHVIEHLEFELLIELMDEIMRTLKPGGLVIFETPNPENVSVTGHNFYVDPTHRKPLPIPMMKYLFDSRGFCRIEVLRLHPSETPRVEGETDLVARFNDYFYGPMDYAIIGSKA